MQHFIHHSSEDQISCNYLKILDQRYNIHLNSLCSEGNYCPSVTDENEKVDTLENQLLTFVKWNITRADN